MVNPYYTAEHLEKQKHYLVSYAGALMKEDAGEHVIVCHDESYFNTRHTNHCSWYCEDSEMSMELIGADNSNRVGTGSGKGERLSIFHSVTKHGLLRY